ncbi:MAG: hypothetical protein AAF616_14935 [Bacteroidota bacterium]
MLKTNVNEDRMSFENVSGGCTDLEGMRFCIPLVLLGILILNKGTAQVFERKDLQVLVKQGAHHLYNGQKDSAFYYAKKIEIALPMHPIAPLLRAMSILWANIPLISPELFELMESHLDSTVMLAKQNDPDLKDPEMVFFSMAAHGVLAEYYADQDHIMKAVTEANKAYGLLKKGFDMVDAYPEFLLATGLYNYFVERYPEKHPVYKPFVWFFRSGDKAVGLKQLEKASRESILTDVEAHVYLSYIYLRYEYKPQLAQKHLSFLCERYPDNYYAKAKYLESLANPKDFQDVSLELIRLLTEQESPYYQLAGYVFLGYYEEVVKENPVMALDFYRKGISAGEQIPDHGEYFKSFGYLGIGRILSQNDEADEAEKMLGLSLKFAETDQVRKEAKSILSQL